MRKRKGGNWTKSNTKKKMKKLRRRGYMRRNWCVENWRKVRRRRRRRGG